MNERNDFLVSKVSITASIRNIPVGRSVTFDCRVAGSLSSAKSTVSRLNKAAGYAEYEIVTHDNGASYIVTHKAPDHD